MERLAQKLIGRVAGRTLTQIRFYTGVPDKYRSQFWHKFWTNKLRYLQNKGIHIYKGRISPVGKEKGVDVSLAIDLIQLTYEQLFDVAILVSQDWDFGPAIKLARMLAREQGRTLTVESAFPVGPGTVNRRGLPGTNWILIEKNLYDRCIDPRDYRSPRSPSS